MEYVTVVLSRSHLPASIVIQAYTWCRWSHAGLVDFETQTVVESTFTHGGVKECSLTDFKERASNVWFIKVPVKSAKAVLDYARSQIGKPYDFLGIAGIAFHQRRWQDDDKWFCFELVAASLTKGGSPYIKDKRISRVTGPILIKAITKPSPYFTA